ncbi:hypothetical protein F5Y04DRAFT_280981 [Hypomontagnella monticulosa]|nr:hypothetical protein F5Y04DRAFT_280981 [Hypomontagnella monticulosa]
MSRAPVTVFDVLRTEGMEPGDGRKLPSEWFVSDASRTFGSGTRSDPKVYWVCKVKDKTAKQIRRTTQVVVDDAKKVGCTHAWIRAASHPFKSQMSRTGARVFETCQPHITVAFGRSDSHILWEGHIWVKEMADKSSAPQRALLPSEVEEARGNPQLWASGSYPYHKLPANYPYSFKLRPFDKLVVYKLPYPDFHTAPQRKP